MSSNKNKYFIVQTLVSAPSKTEAMKATMPRKGTNAAIVATERIYASEAHALIS